MRSRPLSQVLRDLDVWAVWVCEWDWIGMTYLVLSTGEALADELTFERDALLHTKAIIVLRQARLPLLVHHQNELDHGA